MYYLLLFLSQAMVGFNIVGSKHLLATMSPAFILLVRFAIASVFLSLIHIVQCRGQFSQELQRIKALQRRDWLFIIAQAFCAGVLFNYLLYLGLHFTTAAMAGVITSALPALIAIMSIIFLREKMTLFSLLCVIFAVLGLLIININNLDIGNQHGLIGDAIVLLALLPEAGYYVLSKAYRNHLPTFLISAMMCIINLPAILVLLTFTGHLSMPELTGLNMLIAIGLGVATAMFYVFWYIACKHVSGLTAGLFTATMPIATLIIAWIFLGETLSVVQSIGMVLVIISILINALKR